MLATGVVVLCACGPSKPVLPAADALWGSGEYFCARVSGGLQCWWAGTDNPTNPTPLDGAAEVTDMAFAPGLACIADRDGVACKTSQGLQRPEWLAGGTAVASIPGYRGLMCALDARGTALCFRDLDSEPHRLATEARALHTSTDGRQICVETGTDALSCHEFRDKQLAPHQSVDTRVAPPVRRVAANMTQGRLTVLDTEGLRSGGSESTLKVGNPFGVEDPLQVEAELVHIRQRTATLEPIESGELVLEIRAGKHDDFVFDGASIRKVAFGTNREETVEVGGKPTALLAVDERIVYARLGRQLVAHGRVKAKAVHEVIAGVDAPEQVVIGKHQACVRHAGGVSCHPRLAED
ncbi:MAG: hypothetical protein AAF721_11420 [Myxococcota bacterium]